MLYTRAHSTWIPKTPSDKPRNHLSMKLLFLQTFVHLATHQLRTNTYVHAPETMHVHVKTPNKDSRFPSQWASQRYQKYIKKLNSLSAFVKYRSLKSPPFFSHAFTTQSPARQANGRAVHWLRYPTTKDEHVRKFNSSLLFKMSFPSLSVVWAKKGKGVSNKVLFHLTILFQHTTPT